MSPPCNKAERNFATPNRDKIKVAFVIWTLEGMGGSEKVVYDIVRKLDKRFYSIVIVGLTDGPVRKIYEKIGARVFAISNADRVNFSFIRQIRKILLEENIAIINAHHFSPIFYSFLATQFLGMKLVYTEHSRWQWNSYGQYKSF